MRAVEPDLNDPDRPVFEPYERTPEPIPLVITEETVAKAATHLHGAAGLSGDDAVHWENWLTRHKESSQLL